ncbi:hypothetical protein D3C85_1107500 [compost metagenome]
MVAAIGTGRAAQPERAAQTLAGARAAEGLADLGAGVVGGKSGVVGVGVPLFLMSSRPSPQASYAPRPSDPPRIGAQTLKLVLNSRSKPANTAHFATWHNHCITFLN